MYLILRLIAVLGLICLIHLSIFRAGFIDVSGDGFFRALMAYEWRNAPSIVSRDFGFFSLFWFPPYFWLTGTIYWLTDELTASLKLVSYVSSLLGLLVLYRLSCQLTNKRAAIITVLLVGTIPFHLWLSLSMAETTLYLLLVLLGFMCFLRWMQGRRMVYLIGASISFLGGSMLRPEGWILAGMFALYVGFVLVRNRDSKRFWLVISALLPLAFIGFWLADNWAFYGNPVHFMIAQKNHIDSKEYLAAVDWHRAFQPLFFMFVLSPLLFIAIFTGLVAQWQSFERGIRGYFIFVLLYVGALVILFIYGTGTTAAPQRYGLIPLVLLAPFAGWLLSDGLDCTRGVKRVVQALIVVCLATHLVKSFNFPTLYRDVIAAANYIAEPGDPSKPAEFQRMATEFEIRYLVRDLPRTDRDFMTLSAEHAALLAYSARPDGFLTRPLRLKTGKSLLPEPPTEEQRYRDMVKTILENNGIGTVLVRDRRLMEMLPPTYRLVRTFGRYAILTQHGEPVQSGEENSSQGATGPLLAPGIRLAGHRYDGKLYPVNLILQWAFDEVPASACPYQVWVKVVRQVDESDRVIHRIRPVFCWYNLSHSKPGDVVEDYLPLDLPEGLPGGTYKISIALVTLADPVHGSAPVAPPDEVSWQDLPPTRLAFSKRSVLMDHLAGRNRDWSLLLHVLYAL